MKKILLLLIIVITSCSKSNNDEIAQKSSPYSGKWTGTYTGTSDNGVWNITIDSNGSTSGIATSNVYNESYNVVGTITSGGVYASTFGTTSNGGVFNGTFTLNPNRASGNWINNIPNPPITGTFTGTKQ